MRDFDGSYEPQEHGFPEWEGELTTKDGRDWYLVVVLRETREPVLVDGKLRSRASYSLDDAQVFPAVRATYAHDSLTGARLTEWLTRYEAEVADDVAERVADAWVAHTEQRDEDRR